MDDFKHCLRFSKDKYILKPCNRYFWYTVKSEYLEWSDDFDPWFSIIKKTEKQIKKVLFSPDKFLAFFLRKKLKNDFWDGALFSNNIYYDQRVSGFEFKILKPVLNYNYSCKTYICIKDNHEQKGFFNRKTSQTLGSFILETLLYAPTNARFFENCENNYKDLYIELLSNKYEILTCFFKKVNPESFEKSKHSIEMYYKASSHLSDFKKNEDPLKIWKMLTEMAEEDDYSYIILNTIPEENVLNFLEESGNVVLFSTENIPNIHVKVDIKYKNIY